MVKLPDIDDALLDYLFVGREVARVKPRKTNVWRSSSLRDALASQYPRSQYVIFCASLLLVVILFYKMVLSRNVWLPWSSKKNGRKNGKPQQPLHRATGHPDEENGPSYSKRQIRFREKSSYPQTAGDTVRNDPIPHKHECKTLSQKNEDKNQPTRLEFPKIKKAFSNTDVNVFRPINTPRPSSRPGRVARQGTFVKDNGRKGDKYVHSSVSQENVPGKVPPVEQCIKPTRTDDQERSDKDSSKAEETSGKKYARNDSDLSHIVIDRFCDMFCLEATDVQDRLSFSQHQELTNDPGISTALGRCFFEGKTSRQTGLQPKGHKTVLKRTKFYRKYEPLINDLQKEMKYAGHPIIPTGQPAGDSLLPKVERIHGQGSPPCSQSTVSVNEAVTDLMSGDFGIICSKYKAFSELEQLIHCQCEGQHGAMLSSPSCTEGNTTRHSCNDGEVADPHQDACGSMNICLDSPDVRRSQKHTDVKPVGLTSHRPSDAKDAPGEDYASETESKDKRHRISYINGKKELKKEALSSVTKTVTSSIVEFHWEDNGYKCISSTEQAHLSNYDPLEQVYKTNKILGNANFERDLSPYQIAGKISEHSNSFPNYVLGNINQTGEQNSYLTPVIKERFLRKEEVYKLDHLRSASPAEGKCNEKTSPIIYPLEMAAFSTYPRVCSSQKIPKSSSIYSMSKTEVSKIKLQKRALSHQRDVTQARKGLLSKQPRDIDVLLKNSERKLRYYRKYLRQPLGIQDIGISADKTPGVNEIEKQCLKYNQLETGARLFRSKIPAIRRDPEQDSTLNKTCQPLLLEIEKEQNSEWNHHRRVPQNSFHNTNLTKEQEAGDKVCLSVKGARKCQLSGRDAERAELKTGQKKSAGCQVSLDTSLLSKVRRIVKEIKAPNKTTRPTNSGALQGQAQDTRGIRGDPFQIKLNNSPSYLCQHVANLHSKNAQVSPSYLDIHGNEQLKSCFDMSSYTTRNDQSDHDIRGNPVEKQDKGTKFRDAHLETETLANQGLPMTKRSPKQRLRGETLPKDDDINLQCEDSYIHKDLDVLNISVPTGTGPVNRGLRSNDGHPLRAKAIPILSRKNKVNKLSQTSPSCRVSLSRVDDFEKKPADCPPVDINQTSLCDDIAGSGACEGKLEGPNRSAHFRSKSKGLFKSRIPCPVAKIRRAFTANSNGTEHVDKEVIVRPQAHKPVADSVSQTSPAAGKGVSTGTVEEGSARDPKRQVNSTTKKVNIKAVHALDAQSNGIQSQRVRADLRVPEDVNVSGQQDFDVSRVGAVENTSVSSNAVARRNKRHTSDQSLQYRYNRVKLRSGNNDNKVTNSEGDAHNYQHQDTVVHERNETISSPKNGTDSIRRRKRRLSTSQASMYRYQDSAASNSPVPEPRISHGDQIPDMSTPHTVELLEFLRSIDDDRSMGLDLEGTAKALKFLETPSISNGSSSPSPPSLKVGVLRRKPHQLLNHPLEQSKQTLVENDSSTQVSPSINSIHSPPRKLQRHKRSITSSSSNPAKCLCERYVIEDDALMRHSHGANFKKEPISDRSDSNCLRGESSIQESDNRGESQRQNHLNSAEMPIPEPNQEQKKNSTSKSRKPRSQKGLYSRGESKTISKPDSVKRMKTKRQELHEILSRAKQGKKSRKTIEGRDVLKTIPTQEKGHEVQSPSNPEGTINQEHEKDLTTENNVEESRLVKRGQKNKPTPNQRNSLVDGNKAIPSNIVDNASRGQFTLKSRFRTYSDQTRGSLKRNPGKTAIPHSHRQRALSSLISEKRSKSPPEHKTLPHIVQELTPVLSSADDPDKQTFNRVEDHPIPDSGTEDTKEKARYMVSGNKHRHLHRTAHGAQLTELRFTEKEREFYGDELHDERYGPRIGRSAKKDDRDRECKQNVKLPCAQVANIFSKHRLNSVSVSEKRQIPDRRSEASQQLRMNKVQPTGDNNNEQVKNVHKSPVTDHSFYVGPGISVKSSTRPITDRSAQIAKPCTAHLTQILPSTGPRAVPGTDHHPFISRNIGQLTVYSPVRSPETTTKSGVVDISPLWSADSGTREIHRGSHVEERKRRNPSQESVSTDNDTDSLQQRMIKAKPQEQEASEQTENSFKIRQFLETLVKLRNDGSIESGKHLEFNDVPVKLVDRDINPENWKLQANKRQGPDMLSTMHKSDCESLSEETNVVEKPDDLKSTVTKTSFEANRIRTLSPHNSVEGQPSLETSKLGVREEVRNYNIKHLHYGSQRSQSPLKNDKHKRITSGSYQMPSAARPIAKHLGEYPLSVEKVEPESKPAWAEVTKFDGPDESLLPDQLPGKISDSSGDISNASTVHISDRNGSRWTRRQTLDGSEGFQHNGYEKAESQQHMIVDRLRERYLLEMKSRHEHHPQTSIGPDRPCRLIKNNIPRKSYKAAGGQSSIGDINNDNEKSASKTQFTTLEPSPLPGIRSTCNTLVTDIETKPHVSSLRQRKRTRPQRDVKTRQSSSGFRTNNLEEATENRQRRTGVKYGEPSPSSLHSDQASGSLQKNMELRSVGTDKNLSSFASQENVYPSQHNDLKREDMVRDQQFDLDVETNVAKEHAEPVNGERSAPQESTLAGAIVSAGDAPDRQVPSSSHIRKINTTYTILQNQSKSSMAGLRESSLWSYCWDEPVELVPQDPKDKEIISGYNSHLQRQECARANRPSETEVSVNSFQVQSTTGAKDKTSLRTNNVSSESKENSKVRNPNVRSNISVRKQTKDVRHNNNDGHESTTSSADVIISWIDKNNVQESETLLASNIPFFTQAAANTEGTGKGISLVHNLKNQAETSKTAIDTLGLTNDADRTRTSETSVRDSGGASDRKDLSQFSTSRQRPSEIADFDRRHRFHGFHDQMRRKNSHGGQGRDMARCRTKSAFKSGIQKSATSFHNEAEGHGSKTDASGFITSKNKLKVFDGATPQQQYLKQQGSPAGAVHRAAEETSPTSLNLVKHDDDSKSGLVRPRRRVGESRQYVTSALLYHKKKKDKTSPLRNHSLSSEAPNAPEDPILGFNNSATRKIYTSNVLKLSGVESVTGLVSDRGEGATGNGSMLATERSHSDSELQTFREHGDRISRADDHRGNREGEEDGDLNDPQDGGQNGAACLMTPTSSKVYCDWYRPSAASAGNYDQTVAHQHPRVFRDEGSHPDFYTVSVSQPSNTSHGTYTFADVSQNRVVQREIPQSREQIAMGRAYHPWPPFPAGYSTGLQAPSDEDPSYAHQNDCNPSWSVQFGAIPQHSQYGMPFPMPHSRSQVGMVRQGTAVVTNSDRCPTSEVNDCTMQENGETGSQALRYRTHETAPIPHDVSVSNLNSLYQSLQHNYNRMNEVFHSNWILANQNSSQGSHMTSNNPFSNIQAFTGDGRVFSNNQAQRLPRFNQGIRPGSVMSDP